jgi:glycosyltransferase involved in cell wall biosynthesis
MIHHWLDLVLWGMAALFLLMTCSHLYHLRWAHRLPVLGAFDTSLPATRVSIITAARNEEERIESAVRCFLGQEGVEVEVIVVDDRSTDHTGEIVRRLAMDDPRVKSIRVDTLPGNWLGKCHACHAGASAATGDWILFSDADCCLPRDVILRALLVAHRDKVEHITLTPGVAAEGVGAQAWHLAVLLSLLNWLSGVNRDRPRAYLGMGAFNLVRTDAYRACGGYESLRLTVLDDVKLGLLLRRAGKRTRGFIGGDDTQCHWGTTLRELIKIMEKNYFAAIDYRTGAALAAALLGMFMWFGALAGPLARSIAGVASLVGVLSSVLPALVVARRLRWSRWIAALVPFVFPVVFYAMFNSTVTTLRQGGVRWRDTFYSLKLLRTNTVR